MNRKEEIQALLKTLRAEGDGAYSIESGDKDLPADEQDDADEAPLGAVLW